MLAVLVRASVGVPCVSRRKWRCCPPYLYTAFVGLGLCGFAVRCNREGSSVRKTRNVGKIFFELAIRYSRLTPKGTEG